MTKKGRKPVLNKLEAQEIINQYIKKYGVSQKIKYADLHKFCIELFNKKRIDKLPSESFWRKKTELGEC